MKSVHDNKRILKELDNLHKLTIQDFINIKNSDSSGKDLAFGYGISIGYVRRIIKEGENFKIKPRKEYKEFKYYDKERLTK